MRLPRVASISLCAGFFAGLQLAASVFRNLYYGLDRPWFGVIIEAAIVALVGALGFAAAAYLIGRDFRTRTTGFIAVAAYFISMSAANLLRSVSLSPWLFVVCLLVVSFLITSRLGPKWDK